MDLEIHPGMMIEHVHGAETDHIALVGCDEYAPHLIGGDLLDTSGEEANALVDAGVHLRPYGFRLASCHLRCREGLWRAL